MCRSLFARWWVIVETKWASGLRARSAAVVSNHTATVAEFSKERTNVANV